MLHLSLSAKIESVIVLPIPGILNNPFRDSWNTASADPQLAMSFHAVMRPTFGTNVSAIWCTLSEFIEEKPIFGWGASTFFLIYNYYGGNSDAQHTHNIFLQLAYDYGILVALIILIFISSIIFKSIRYLKSNKIITNSIDKYWIIASMVTFIFHQLDFPYYDGRVSIILWTLLAGLKNILKEGNKLETKTFLKNNNL